MLRLPAGLRRMQSSSVRVWRGSRSQRALSRSYHRCRTPGSGASRQQSWLRGGTCGAQSTLYAALIPQVSPDGNNMQPLAGRITASLQKQACG